MASGGWKASIPARHRHLSKVDLANLRAWLSPDTASRLSGSAEGELRVEGPALNWKALQAELRIPNFEMGPAPNTELASAPLRIRNQGPIVARFANSIVTIESATSSAAAQT